MYPATKSLPRRLIVLLCALFLLGAQQAAFTHLIGHFSFVAKTVTPSGNEHGSEPSLSHVCTACLAFAALSAAAPLLTQLPAVPQSLVETLVRAKYPRIPAPGLLPYAARAPPALL